ncbi:hypothetical protein OSB04_006974 [Centaurea solstitialis]|uniref:SWIM-type domain-containing protein n=1 Tax=Centaurea solstitialis TaxID=347529 RepID=A0AA38WSB6_9ASTR|nr:hypothetical protein OSB04_006974 [Centaurea solstitialis]
MASSSNSKDVADNFQLTDDESDDITYKMSVKGSDNDYDNEEDLEAINVDDIVANVNDDNNGVENAYHIAQALLPNLIKNQDMSLKEMKKYIFEKYLCNVSFGHCHRGKGRGIHQIEGSLSEHYGRVWDYGEEIIRSNLGSIVKIVVEESDNGNYFKGFYVCFKAVKDGWKLGCRPVIGLDGCFLKSICKGELLTTIGRDANSQVYLIAWAVYDIENKENWSQFINFLAKDLELSQGAGLTLLSDQHKGLIEVVKDILPQVSHVKEEFKSLMLELKQISKDAYNHLMRRNSSSWCRAFFKKDRTCEAVENGICESFNKMILDARKKPIITLLGSIRLLVMQRMHIMSNMVHQYENDVFPTILDKLKLFSGNYRSWSVIPSNGHVFETRKGTDSFYVDLEKGICSCTFWQLAGIPCVHGVASII